MTNTAHEEEKEGEAGVSSRCKPKHQITNNTEKGRSVDSKLPPPPSASTTFTFSRQDTTKRLREK